MTTRKLAFVGDVGGTNARFALVENDAIVQGSMHNCINREHTSIIEAIQSFLTAHGNPQLSEACIALACPITGDTVKLTNCDWQISKKAIHDSFGLSEVLLVNDFTALAMGVPSLGDKQYYTLGEGTAQHHYPIGVMGAGTGFGVSGLIWAHGHWVPLQGEGGHISFAPADELEIEVLRIGWKEYGGRLSVERILSGDGLEFLYLALCQIKGIPSEKLKASDITKQAVDDPKSIGLEVVNIFCSVLGGVAGDWALELGAWGGIYIGGGIVPRLGDIVKQSPLRARFEAKARFKGYVARIPIRVITDSVQTALMGAASILNDRK